jgi:sec-independent protein translocase protein TatA
MEGFGVDKLVLILVIVLVLFGARRIPEIGASIGKGIRELKHGLSDLGSDDEADAKPAAAPPREASTIAEQPEPGAPAQPDPKRLLGR